MAKVEIKPFKRISSGKINISDYISDAGLDALYVLEGHTDASKVENMRDNKITHDWTGVYGITNSAIKEVKLRAKEAGIKLPKEMMSIKSAKELGKDKKDVARMYAGYMAWVNDTKMNQITDNAFSTYNSHQKDVLLSYLHNIDVSQMTTGTAGSLVDAIKIHNEDEVIRKIFMKPDGSYVDYETLRKANKRGVGNRLMATMQWWYNPDADVIKSISEKDNLYNTTYNEVGRMKNMLLANSFLVEDTKKRKNEDIKDFSSSIIPMLKEEKKVEEQLQQPIAAPKPAQERTFMEKMADGVKAAYNAIVGDSNQVADSQGNILNNANGEQA